MSLTQFEAQFGLRGLLPPSARRIYFTIAVSREGRGAYIYRFAATREDCVAHARKVFSHYAERVYGHEEHQAPAKLAPVTATQVGPDLSAYGRSDIGWFDVDSIHNGVILPRPRRGLPYLLIDKDRNVLYSFYAIESRPQ